MVNNVFKHMSLLYAEDEIVTQTLYRQYFESFFKTIYIAENGRQALDIYYEKKPDIIVLDINMPILDGLEVCKTIRTLDKKTKLVLLTNHTDKHILLEAIELGLSTYLEKPISKQQLGDALAKIASEFDASHKISLWKQADQYFCWDKKQRELLCNSKAIALTKKEKLLLELLIETKQEKTDYQKIYKVVWFDDYIGQKYSEIAIKSLIKKLRAKLPSKAIINSYGIGYSLNRFSD